MAVRVGIVTHYMPPHTGGIERVAECICRGYQQSGFEVRWVSSRIPPDTPRRSAVCVRVHSWNGPERWFGVPVPIWGLEAWREINALARWADILHVHDCLYAGSVWSVALGRRYKKHIVLSQHVGPVRYQNVLLNLLEESAYRTIGRAVLARATHLVYATPAAETYVPSLLGYSPRQACSIPNGIDLSLFEARSPSHRRASRANLGLPFDARVVLFVGRLVEKKGVQVILEVSRLLPNAHFLVIGTGPLSRLLTPSQTNVTWLPAVEHDRMTGYYHAADCLLLPSRGEGLPLVVQEALACGLPVIVSNTEAYAAQLLAADACVAATPSAELMATAVTRLLDDRPAGLANRSRLYAQTHWDVNHMVERYVALLQNMGREAHSTLR